MLKYIELNDDRVPLTKFDITHSSMEDLRNAGLLLNKNLVVVDFDNDNYEEQKIIDYLITNYPTLTVKTTRGVHFYYIIPINIKINKTADKITVGGFQVDYLTGTKAYAIVKHKGKERERNGELRLTNLPPLPEILYPVYKNKTNLSGLSEGDGRNNALFYHLRCIRETYVNMDIMPIAEFINKNIFADPLKSSELETIVDSVLTQPIAPSFYKDGKADIIAFAKFLVTELNIKRYTKQTYVKSGLCYSADEELLQVETSKHLELKKNQFAELRHQLIAYADRIPDNATFKVKVRNGTILDNEVIDCDSGFTPFFLDITYDPKVKDENVDKFLDFLACDRQDMRYILEEIIGHIIMTHRFPAHTFFLTGNGANGKSTFVNMLNNFTQDLSSNIDISNFSDGTSLLELKDKLVNIADDIDNTFISKAKYLKTLASGDRISERAIYGKPVKMNNTATLIFTANEVPDFKDKTGGNKRRIMIIPFDNEVKKRDPKLIDLLTTDNAKSYLLNLALAGVKRIIDNGYKMSYSETIENATKQYHINNDSVVNYINEYSDIHGNLTDDVYNSYKEFCDELEKTPVKKETFSKRLNPLGYIVKNTTRMGKKVKVYVKKV